jgi:hypothetical protein
MGAVYKARQPALGRWVALKVLPSGQGAGSAERFNREARALARLNHPNIVAVHDFGQVEGLHFLIMEFVDGTNLRQLEKSARLSPREALQIIPQICDALQYAHDEGVVHRDIKPENVLVDRKGRVKIADFGLAKILDREPATARLTAEGQVMGTPHYMAPEQVERPLAVDHRADIYALGVVFYEMLTGDLPIGKFSPPSRKVELDIRIDEIVLRALENDPERRYQRASEVKSEVQTVLETTSRPPADPGPAPIADTVVQPSRSPGNESGKGLGATSKSRWATAWRHHPIRTLGLVALVVLLLAGAGFQLLRARFARLTGMGETSTTLVARPDPQRGVWFVELPNGTRLELLAISRLNAAPNQWWRPDGTLLTNVAFGIDGPAGMPGDDAWKSQLAFRVIGDSAVMETAIHEFTPAANVSAGGFVVQDGVKLDGGWPLRVGWLAAPTTATLRFGLRYEPWRAIAVANLKDPSQSRTITLAGDPKWIASFNHFSDDGTNTLLTVVLNRQPRDWRMRVVAVDTAGGEHPFNRGSSTPVEGTETWTCTFPELTLDRVVEFQVQVQPVHWAEFRDVALHPSGALPPADLLMSRQGMDQAAQRDLSSGALVADLPGGGRIELLAIGDPSAAPTQWWRPDGSLLTNALYAVSGLSPVLGQETRPWDLIFRFSDLPTTTGIDAYDFDNAFDVGHGGIPHLDGQRLEHARAVRVAWPSHATLAAFRIGVGIGEWTKLSTHFPPGPSATWNRERGLPGFKYLLHELAGTPAGLRATFVIDKPHPDWRTRLVAFDAADHEFPGTAVGSTSTGTARLEVYEFKGLTAESLRRIQAHARPLHWVAFRDVGLAPRVTPPASPAGTNSPGAAGPAAFTAP